MRRAWCSRWAIWRCSTNPTFRLRSEVLDVGELLDDIAVRFGQRAAQPGRAAAGAASGRRRMPRRRVAALDIELFERAIANLVDNALKFCRSGDSVDAVGAGAGRRVEVCVADTGPGIPTADVPHLFDRFYQARQSVAPSTGAGGKGLGLAIVKRIAELHGGEVRVRQRRRARHPGDAGAAVGRLIPGAALWLDAAALWRRCARTGM